MAPSPQLGTHREIEIKLDADPAYALPDLAAIPGVEQVAAAQLQQLEAVYLDTDDLRLIRHGTTFRRRTGGTDAGWHLKLPAGGRERIEVHRAPGRSVKAVPAQLLGLVRVQLRGAPVAPVARIATARTVHQLLGPGGAVLAEVADDLVTAEALGDELTATSWREIEVELVTGDEALLDAAQAVLVGAGARPASSPSKLRRALDRRLAALETGPETRPGTKAAKPTPVSAGDVVVEYLTGQVAALIAEDPRVRLSAEEGVHQMRVATRRLRTNLASFRALFADGAGEPLRAELKWLAGVLGEARDAEVIRQRLRQAIAAQPAVLVIGPVARRIDVELRKTYREAHAKVVEALDSERYLALVAALEEFVAAPPLSPRGRAGAAKELRKRVRAACRRVQRAAAALAGPGEPAGDQAAHDHRLHEVRIAAKRARYAAETARSVVGDAARDLAKAMAEVQETLGDHQDAVVERAWLRDLAVKAFLAGENSFTFGRLHGLTDARAQHDEEIFAEVWARTQAVIEHWPGA